MKRLTLLIFALVSILLATSASSESSSTCRLPVKLDERISELNHAVESGNLGLILELQLSLVPYVEENQRLSKGQTLSAISQLTNLLIRLNKLRELESQSAYLLSCYPANESNKEVRSELLTGRIVAALHQRDIRTTSDALRAFGREFPSNMNLTRDMQEVKDIAECVDNKGIRQRCRDGDSTMLYGYFSAENNLDGRGARLEGQCLKPVGSDEYFPPPPRFLEANAKAQAAILSFNAACHREAVIGSAMFAWDRALKSGSPDAAQSAERLIEELDSWAIEIDGFDPENQVSRFQARALSFYVRQITRLQRTQRMIVQPLEETRSASMERAAIQPYFDAALPYIVAGQVGFLKIDNIGLAGFVARHATWLGQGQGEAIWQLVGATFGTGSNLKTRSLADVRAAMSDEEVLVTAVHPQDGMGVIMAVGKTGWPWIQELNLGSEVRTRQMGELISEAVAERPTEASLFPLAAARELYAAYICPVGLVHAFKTIGTVSLGEDGTLETVPVPLEAEPSTRKTLIFVPDQVLERIPLSLLSKPIGGCLGYRPARNVFAVVRATDLKNVDWISDEFSVRIMPFQATNTVNDKSSRIGSSEGTPYLGVGPANRSRPLQNLSNDPKVSQSNFAAAQPFLAGAQAEFTNLTAPAFIGGTLLSTSNATERKLRLTIETKPRILHFATHGLDPASNQLVIEPLLVLTRGTDTTDTFDDDGVLTASEISRFELPDTRVVLSACKTASPAIGLGKGIFSGLVQSFFDAGAKEVVATYWPVDDEAAAILMPNFVSKIASRNDTATALFEAQNAFRLNHGSRYNGLWNHPYFWAPFIDVIPNGGPRP